jgi:hypothetical protein
MSEQTMLELVQHALTGWGVEDTVHTVGQFEPRGTTGGTVAGGLVGSSIGDVVGGSVGDAIGFGVGVMGGRAASRASSGLPAHLLVAVSDTMVYGMTMRSRRKEPDALVFALPRSAVTAKVHQRVNVRVLELIRNDTGARIELEGSRIPVTHSHDVITALTKT